jgi:hypothetical protein
LFITTTRIGVFQLINSLGLSLYHIHGGTIESLIYLKRTQKEGTRFPTIYCSYSA